jgi:hypothetical protein
LQLVVDALHARYTLHNLQSQLALVQIGDDAFEFRRAVLEDDVHSVMAKLPALAQALGDGIGHLLIGSHAHLGRLLPKKG